MRSKGLNVREIAIFAMLGTIMFVSKLVMEFLPNIHLLGALTMLYTLVFRYKALIPIYIYVMMNGLYAGFAAWWVPYLYIWTVLWGMTMLLPPNMPPKVAYIVYPVVCMLHGLMFGTLYSFGQAIMYGFTFEQTLAWIVSGFGFDVLHAIGNFVAGFVVLPLSWVLNKLRNKYLHA